MGYLVGELVELNVVPKNRIFTSTREEMTNAGLLAPSLCRLYPRRWPLVICCPLLLSSIVLCSLSVAATVILLPLSPIHCLIVVFVCCSCCVVRCLPPATRNQCVDRHLPPVQRLPIAIIDAIPSLPIYYLIVVLLVAGCRSLVVGRWLLVVVPSPPRHHLRNPLIDFKG